MLIGMRYDKHKWELFEEPVENPYVRNFLNQRTIKISYFAMEFTSEI